jgi:hypothetical protein
MPIYLWILELFLLLLFLHSINAIINPAKIVNWTIDRYKGILKFYCFEGEIKATPNSAKIIRIGHLIVATVLFIYMLFILFFSPIL